MKGWIINGVAGAGLFVGSLLGALAATGRLNHDGVANIPLLNGLFPAPPVDPSTDPHAAEAAGAGPGQPADAHSGGDGGQPVDAGHGKPDSQEPEHSGAPQGQEPQPLKRGRSIFETEAKADGQGGGHGEEGGGDKAEHGDPHGGKPKGGHEGGDGGHETEPPHEPAAEHPAAAQHPAEHDFEQLADELAQDRKSHYAPGGYFRFDGMPSGITPEKLNEAWRRVAEITADLDKRNQTLDLRDKELREFADDIARRQTELGKERLEVENLQRKLDERIEKFQEQVKLVRTDEVAGLKRNAATLASFEASKAAELITEQWKLETGQDEVLKTLEFMEPDAVNGILAALPNGMIREVLQKRLKVSREPAPPAK